MGDIPNTIRKRSGYYGKVRIPKAVRDCFPQRSDFIERSLGTKDPTEARLRAARFVAEWRMEFARQSRLKNPSDGDLQLATWEFYERELSIDEAERVAGGRSPETRAMFRKAIMAELAEHAATGETALVEWAADELIKANDFKIEKGSETYRDLCHQLLRAQMEAVKRFSERDAGDYGGTPTDPAIRPPRGSISRRAEAGETILEKFARFAAHKEAVIKSDTLRKYEEAVTLFAEHVGEATHIEDAFTKKNAREFVDALDLLPSRAKQMSAFKGLTFPKIIKANERAGKPAITARTKNNHISGCSEFSRWLERRGEIESNPFHGLMIPVDKEANKISPFTVDELNALFQSPIYTGALSDDKMHEPGNVAIRNHFYWLPLILAFTGARISEPADLRVDDIENVAGHWVFKMPTMKKGKDARDQLRDVPVHPILIKLGFLKYRDRIMATGETRLFPEIEPDTRGQIAGKIDKTLNRYLQRIGISTPNNPRSMHSFRHGFTDAGRDAGLEEVREIALLIGHGERTMTTHYGTKREGTIKQRAEWIKQIEYNNLNLSHLF